MSTPSLYPNQRMSKLQYHKAMNWYLDTTIEVKGLQTPWRNGEKMPIGDISGKKTQ